mgnify:CR=1 FL=1
MVVKGAWKHHAVIHEKEWRVRLLRVLRAARCAPLHGRRLLSLGDNLSSTCSIEKGRSKRFALQRLCQRAGPLAIACEIDWHLRYRESLRTPTDFDLRAADRGEVAPGETVSCVRGRLVLRVVRADV